MNEVMNILFIFVRFCIILIQDHSFKNAYHFCRFKSSTSRRLRSKFTIFDKGLLHRVSNNRILFEHARIFSNNIEKIDFYASKGLLTYVDQGKIEFIFSIHNSSLKVIVSNKEELSLFHEIFILTPYSFDFLSDCVVLDLGMNIGFASLFFASKINVKKVFSYELVPDTFQIAISNFELNSPLESKIQAYPLGADTRNSVYTIDPEPAGSVGASITKNRISEDDNSKMTVHCKDIKIIIDEITTYFNLPLVIKMDCEGAEYALLKELETSGYLSRISLIMIEWHNNGAGELVDILRRHGFTTFDFKSETHSQIGFIYATKI